jgi:phosphoribosylaminoimidazole (AIR) synthetase
MTNRPPRPVVGVVERDAIIDGSAIREGDAGLGIVLAVAPDDAEDVLQTLPEAWVCGETVAGEGVTWR